MATTFTPYTTGAEFFGPKPAWIVDPLDMQRIQSYDTYEQMYWNVPDIYKVSLRGTNNLPIYVPSARTIIDTTNRYVGRDFRVVISGEGDDAVAAQIAITDFIRRERFRSKFNGQKRYGLIQGDSIWHLTADEAKAQGSRITLTALDPSMYFPITDPEDVDRIIGVHLVEPVTIEGEERIRRLTYRKTENGTITVEEGIFKPDAWSADTDKPERVIQQLSPLPPVITSLPVYHTKNTEEPGNPFGSSEVRGLERMMGAVNQTMSDEDLALALDGIGMYATDGSQPIDPVSKKPVAWQLGPGRVVHYDGKSFNRIQGVTDLGGSYGAHYDRLWEALKQSSSTPDIAIGKVDVSVAQSGVALQIQLGPMLAKAGEKNDLLLDVQNQMFYDILNMWFPAYEQTTFKDIGIECVVGDAVPIDRTARFAELNDMLDRGVIDTEYYRTEAKKLGYEFPSGMAGRAKAEYDDRQADQFGTRLASETDDGSVETES